MWFGFGLIFLSYEIALVIFAERDIKFASHVALSLSSLCVSQTKKKAFYSHFYQDYRNSH